jgi:hypothetical protein
MSYTQKDLQQELTQSDAIGMGGYNSDSHNVQRIVDKHGLARHERDMRSTAGRCEQIAAELGAHRSSHRRPAD